MELLVLDIPGLSVRLIRDHADAAPGIARVGGEGSAAALIPLAGASRAQLEAALITGMLPEYLGAFGGGVGESRGLPFWVKAAKRRKLRSRVDTAMPLPERWRADDADPHFVWHTLAGIADAGPTRTALREVGRKAAPLIEDAQTVVVVSAWAFALDGSVAPQEASPLDRPVLLARGLEHGRATLGILEVAGMLERELTGEVLRDQR
jgi:hypothetical protein